MSVRTDRQRCTGCPRLPEPKCVECCPGNLMTLDGEGKATVRSPADCWDCMACVKACPPRALSVRLPYQVALYGADLSPVVRKDRIVWTLRDASGKEEQFEIKTRW